MGMVQSICCSLTLCIERMLTWACCAFLLMLLMFTLVLLTAYGITVGYHFAQIELASFAIDARPSTPKASLRSDYDFKPVVRLVAVNQTNKEEPVLEVYNTKRPQRVYLDRTETNIVLLETERPPKHPALSLHEREFAKRLIGRFRRSKNVTTDAPFIRPLQTVVKGMRLAG